MAATALISGVMGFRAVRLRGFQLDGLVFQQVLSKDYSIVVSADPWCFWPVLHIHRLHKLHSYHQKIDHAGRLAVRIEFVAELMVAAEL